MIHGIILISLIVYTVFIAIPFVPPVEVGWGLMLLPGADLAPLVYLFTIVGMSRLFGICRFVLTIPARPRDTMRDCPIPARSPRSFARADIRASEEQDTRAPSGNRCYRTPALPYPP